MEVPDNLEPIESLEDRRYLLVVLVMNDNTFMPSIRCLKTEGMLDNKTVLQPVTKQKTEAFPLINLSRAEEDVDKRIF